MNSAEGFPLPERLCPFSDRSTSLPGLTKQLKRLHLNEMKLRVIKLDNNQWLQRRGKKQYIGFTPQYKQEAKQLFEALDADGSGAISLDELYQPLLAAGIVESKAQVQTLFGRATTGRVLEFKEFLQMLETGKNDSSPVGQLVKEYIFRKQDVDKRHLPHQVLISMRRRKLMLQAYQGETQASKEKGMKVLKAFSSELAEEHKPLSKTDLLLEKKREEVRRTMNLRGSQTTRLRSTLSREAWLSKTHLS